MTTWTDGTEVKVSPETGMIEFTMERGRVMTQRIIKFRGWHPKLERMIPCEELVADQLTLLADGRFINVYSVSTTLSDIYPSDKFIPLQFTGLFDKSGVKIFEGPCVPFPRQCELQGIMASRCLWLVFNMA